MQPYVSRISKTCTKEFTLALDSDKNPENKNEAKSPSQNQGEKKSITGHKVTAFLFVSHAALLKQVFQVVLGQPVLCNTPLNVFHLVFPVVAAGMKSLLQCLPFDAGRARLPPQEQICPSVSLWKTWKIFFVVNSLCFPSLKPSCGSLFPNFTLVHGFEVLISLLYVALRSSGLGQS